MKSLNNNVITGSCYLTRTLKFSSWLKPGTTSVLLPWMVQSGCLHSNRPSVIQMMLSRHRYASVMVEWLSWLQQILDLDDRLLESQSPYLSSSLTHWQSSDFLVYRTSTIKPLFFSEFDNLQSCVSALKEVLIVRAVVGKTVTPVFLNLLLNLDLQYLDLRTLSHV